MSLMSIFQSLMKNSVHKWALYFTLSIWPVLAALFFFPLATSLSHRIEIFSIPDYYFIFPCVAQFILFNALAFLLHRKGGSVVFLISLSLANLVISVLYLVQNFMFLRDVLAGISLDGQADPKEIWIQVSRLKFFLFFQLPSMVIFSVVVSCGFLRLSRMEKRESSL